MAKLSIEVYKYLTKLMIISQFSPEHYRVQTDLALNYSPPITNCSVISLTFTVPDFFCKYFYHW